MSRATESALSDLHDALAKAFAQAIKPKPIIDAEGEILGYETSPAALNAARQFLKDNNITCSLANKPMKDLVDGLPSFEDQSSFQPGQSMN